MALRSATAQSNRRAVPAYSAPTSRPHPVTPLATAITTTNNDDKGKQSNKSVFPLFFNVL